MKLTINDGMRADGNWHIEGFDTKDMEKIRNYLKQKFDVSVGSHPERNNPRSDKMFLFMTKENISKEQLQGWLDSYQP